jgi:autoinducer 2-degrading protein
MKQSGSNSALTRVVKMKFRAGEEAAFLEIFERSKPHIRAFPGCLYLELFNERNNPSVFFTYSKWDQESSLEAYRKSELFRITWQNTKALFLDKAEAWSLSSLHICP